MVYGAAAGSIIDAPLPAARAATFAR